MGSAKELIASIANVLTLAALGVFYTQTLQYVMSFAAMRLPQVLSSAEKMMLTGASTAIAITLVFAFNRLVTRQSMIGLGLSCGLMAFVYFYIVKLWPDPSAAVLVLFTSYSLFAMIAFTIGPVLTGFVLQRSHKMSGFRSILAQGR